MKRRRKADRKYRQQEGRNYAFIEVDGKRIPLRGEFNSAESLADYHQWLAKLKLREVRDVDLTPPDTKSMAVFQLGRRYLDWCEVEYPGNPKRGEYANNCDAVKRLIAFQGSLAAAAYGPKALKEFQRHLSETPKRRGKETLSRRYVNGMIERVKRMFKWAVSEELVPGGTYHALESVAGLRKGKSSARETAKRKAVPLSLVAPILRHVPPVVRAMLRVQVFTGARSGTICAAKPEQFDRSGPIWFWRPKHKTEHLDVDLVLPVGPRCQRILKPFLEAAKPGQFLFNPRSVRKDMRYHDHYTSGSYRVAVVRGIAKANRRRKPDEQIPAWTPHRIRHYKGDTVNARYGIEAAQAVLGHDSMNATKIYRSRRLGLATEIAKETG